MQLKGHIILSGISGVAGYLGTYSLELAGGMLVSGIFIDLDHFVDYFINEGQIKIDIKDFFRKCVEIGMKKFYVPLHSYELIIPFVVISFMLKNFLLTGISLGLLIHLIADVLTNRLKLLAYSFIWRLTYNFEMNKMLPDKERK